MYLLAALTGLTQDLGVFLNKHGCLFTFHNVLHAVDILCLLAMFLWGKFVKCFL